MLVTEQIDTIVKLLQKKAAAWLIILFGSYAKGCEREDSDVDVAYLSDFESDGYENFMLGQEIAVAIGKDVDLVALRSASTVLRAQVISSGRVLFCSDEKRRQLYVMRMLKEYALLNEERAVILQQIKERGNIYG